MSGTLGSVSLIPLMMNDQAKQIIRAAAVLVSGFLTFYFADSSTRLFVNHALAYDSIFFGGFGLLGGFVAALITVILVLRYLKGYWIIAGLGFMFFCMLAAECAFRITGVPLNTFHVALAFAAHGDKGNLIGEFSGTILNAAAQIAVVLGVGYLAGRVIKWRPSGRLVLGSTTVSVLILSIGRPDFEGLVFVPSPLGLPFVAARTVQQQIFRERGPVRVPLARPIPVQHTIYIVDETVRADHISVGQKVSGTSEVSGTFLGGYGGVVSLGEAVAAANCSVQAQYLLRTGVIPQEIPDVSRATLSKPNIFAYAQKAGRKTYFLDGQSPGLTNYMSRYDLTGTESEIGLYVDIDKCTKSGECALIDRMREIASKNESNFMYVVKSGSHWPYEHRYPASQRIHQPVAEAEDQNPTHRENSYKNSVRWNIDLFFKELLGDGALKNYLIIYTGDHGEDLNPGPHRSPHCGHDNKVRPIEGIVPILLFTDRADLKSAFTQVAQLRYNKASQFDLFPSWLILFGYDRPAVFKSYGPSIFDPQLRPQRFYWGDIFSDYGGYQRVTLGSKPKTMASNP